MTLLATQLSDLVATTQRDLGKPNFVEIATDIQEHTAMSELLRMNSIEYQSGYGVQWDVMVQHSNSAENVGLGAEDNVDIVDTMVQAQADWRNTTANYAFIGQEIDMNRNPARIVDLLRSRRIATMIAVVELMETNFWGPPVASTDNVTPWGVKTWIVKNATEGFNGGAPSGYTTIGLNPTTYSRWKNYTAQYTSLTKEDAVRKWRRASRFTNFKPPVANIPTGKFQGSNKYGYYTNYTVLSALEEMLEAQNDNLGNDVASKDGEVTFRKTPVKWVPKLEADTTNPIYGINWGAFRTIILSGWWGKEFNVPIYPGQHTINATFMDYTYQMVTTNRRVHFVLATGTSEPS